MKKNVFIQPHHDKGERERAKSEINEPYRKLAEALKPHIMVIVERAFRTLLRGHGAPKEAEDLEWERFKKILNRTL